LSRERIRVIYKGQGGNYQLILARNKKNKTKHYEGNPKPKIG
jgi:hypothetical protein